MKANEQQQTVYNYFMLNVRAIIYGDHSFKMVLEKMKSKDPLTGIAHTAAMTVNNVKNGMEQSKGPLPKEIIARAMLETVGELALIAQKYKLVPDAKAAAKQAVPMAVKIMGETQGAAKQPSPGQPAPEAPPQPQAPPPPPQGGLINQAVGA